MIRIEAMLDRVCRVGNPWEDGAVDLYLSGGKGLRRLNGRVLEFALRCGDQVLLVPAGTDIGTVKDTVGPDFPAAVRRLDVILPDGKKGTAYLGKF